MFANTPVSLLRNMLTTPKTAECSHEKINIKNRWEERRTVFVFVCVCFLTHAMRQTKDAVCCCSISEPKMLVDGGDLVLEPNIFQIQEQIIKILNRHQTLHSNDSSRSPGDSAIVKIFCFPLIKLTMRKETYRIKKTHLCITALKTTSAGVTSLSIIK